MVKRNLTNLRFSGILRIKLISLLSNGEVREGSGGELTLRVFGKAIGKPNIIISFLKLFLKCLYDYLCKSFIKLSQSTFQRDKDGVHGIPPLAEELLAVDSC